MLAEIPACADRGIWNSVPPQPLPEGAIERGGVEVVGVFEVE